MSCFNILGTIILPIAPLILLGRHKEEALPTVDNGEGIKVMSDIIPLIRSLLESSDFWDRLHKYSCSYLLPLIYSHFTGTSPQGRALRQWLTIVAFLKEITFY